MWGSLQERGSKVLGASWVEPSFSPAVQATFIKWEESALGGCSGHCKPKPRVWERARDLRVSGLGGGGGAFSWLHESSTKMKWGRVPSVLWSGEDFAISPLLLQILIRSKEKGKGLG